MGASQGRLARFFCDRNLGKRVLAARGWNVERHDDHFAQDTPDDVILREIRTETPPYIVAVYKDGTVRRLDLTDDAEEKDDDAETSAI